jgi:molecular chaperone DnaK
VWVVGSGDSWLPAAAVRGDDRPVTGGLTIGIDLGTTNTCAAIVQQGRARVIASELGYTTIPSIVTFDDAGELLVGQRAERRLLLRPEDTIYGSKRLLGRSALRGAHARFQSHFS